MKKAIVLLAGLCLGGQASAMPTQQAVLEHYADLAHAMYQDSLTTAKALQKAVPVTMKLSVMTGFKPISNPHLRKPSKSPA